MFIITKGADVGYLYRVLILWNMRTQPCRIRPYSYITSTHGRLSHGSKTVSFMESTTDECSREVIQSPIEWDKCPFSWWRHHMETFSALLALCAGNSPVTGEFRTPRPVTRSFDVFFDLRLNKRLSKQTTRCWFEAHDHYDVIVMYPANPSRTTDITALFLLHDNLAREDLKLPLYIMRLFNSSQCLLDSTCSCAETEMSFWQIGLIGWTKRCQLTTPGEKIHGNFVKSIIVTS